MVRRKRNRIKLNLYVYTKTNNLIVFESKSSGKLWFKLNVFKGLIFLVNWKKYNYLFSINFENIFLKLNYLGMYIH